MPVATSASCAERESWMTSPKAVMESGPRTPAARSAAETRCAMRQTLTAWGTWQFSKSHHTDTFTALLSSSRSACCPIHRSAACELNPRSPPCTRKRRRSACCDMAAIGGARLARRGGENGSGRRRRRGFSRA